LVSLDGSDDVDLYQFHTTGPNIHISATVTPTSETYLEGAQNAGGSCSAGSNFNSLVVRDLRLELVDSSGSTVASMNAQGAGAAETLVYTTGNSTGPYIVRMLGDAADNVQLYDLSMSALNVDNDLPVQLSATPNEVILRETQVLEVQVVHSGPANATQVTLDVAFTNPLIVDSAYFTQGSGSVNWTNHQVTVDIGTLSGNGQAAIAIEVHHAGSGTGTATAQVTRAEADPI
jgi:hypothetical protein